MAQKTILIACVSGMSSSLLISKLAQVVEQAGKDYGFITSPASKLKTDIQAVKPDVVLLAPQIQYLRDEVQKTTALFKIPLSVINIQDYAMMDSPKIITTIENLLNSEK
ncbi:PTS sugar transporter subunit IIB [Lactobacillus sp. PV034]|uniref:PTS sugar transporter subunit IIB n=1 Tax=Lactobacillus sp. PV034 TaxID=2594495 RepID=UPI0022408352|nr:PTS sugar transporter subunit IIB [Lactobacillus sp. PV034]QNQ80979.1 PTS sugar transporter subunit IIB [Lactobacillus sp. PV034]